jgi:hypothetical protein
VTVLRLLLKLVEPGAARGRRRRHAGAPHRQRIAGGTPESLPRPRPRSFSTSATYGGAGLVVEVAGTARAPDLSCGYTA